MLSKKPSPSSHLFQLLYFSLNPAQLVFFISPIHSSTHSYLTFVSSSVWIALTKVTINSLSPNSFSSPQLYADNFQNCIFTLTFLLNSLSACSTSSLGVSYGSQFQRVLISFPLIILFLFLIFERGTSFCLIFLLSRSARLFILPSRRALKSVYFSPVPPKSKPSLSLLCTV